MKYLLRLFFFICAGAFIASCQDEIPGENETEYGLSASTPSVTPVSSTAVKVKASASGSHITYRGLCYATHPSPTLSDITVKSFQRDINVLVTPLAPGTTYYIRSFVQTKDQVVYSGDAVFTTAGDDTSDDEKQIEGPEALRRVSVHDPSVVWDPATSNYFIFGSHRASARSTNLMSWTAFTAPWQTAASSNAANKDAFSAPQVTKVTKGGQVYEFVFDALAWSTLGKAGYSIDGNMWAPDVIWNKQLNKWCMYLSINGDAHYSSIILLTADNIAGPYRYQAPVVISGFYTGDNFKKTDVSIVLGTETLPGRYLVGSTGAWGNRYPNAIDPCVFYDETGKLWMSYGSWSGGIYMLELDEKTGLRNYDVTYSLQGSGDNITVDPYFGKKIAGGFYSSGEASYIEHIGNYYYLFMSNGGLTAGGVPTDYNAGGYQMRVFRSEKAEGPYVDSQGQPALLTAREVNFGPSDKAHRGVNIFGCYNEWGYQVTGDWGERSQGHNSVIAAPDGRAYLVYHTRFQRRGEGHEVRVHQLFQNEEGWLVAAPFEYTGEVMKTARMAAKQYVATPQIPGKYKVLEHPYALDHRKKDVATPKDIVLNGDGTISGDYTGTWKAQEGTSFVTLNIGKTYKGVMVEQNMEASSDHATNFYNGKKTPCFTGLDSSTGVTVWAYKVD